MIKLSKMADYAVVLLSAMAAGRGTLFTASALAAQSGLPEPTVSKLLKTLVRAGFVSSSRGANGGYVFEKEAELVTMADVIAAVDGPLTLTSCVGGSQSCCAHERRCSMKGRWDPVNAAMVKALEGVSLARMMERA